MQHSPSPVPLSIAEWLTRLYDDNCTLIFVSGEGAMPGLTCTCASSGVEVVVFLLLPVTEGSIFGPEKSRKIRHAKTDLCRAVCWAICNKLTISIKEERKLGRTNCSKREHEHIHLQNSGKILSAVG